MASFHRHGKERDRSTPWSAWTWDPRGYYFASRYGPSGDVEYDYRYPDSGQDQTVPRTPAQDSIDNPTSSYQASSDTTAVNSYPSDTANSYTTSAPAPAIATTYSVPATAAIPVSSYQESSNTTTVTGYPSETVNSYPTSTPAGSTTYASPETATHTSSRASFFPASNQASQPNWNSSTSSNAVTTVYAGVSSSYAARTSSSSYTTPPTGSSYSSTNYGVSGITEDLGAMRLNSIDSNVPENDYPEEPADYPDESADTVALPPGTKNIYPNPDYRNYEELDPRYKVVENKNLKKFWRFGRVFMMLWTEPARTQLVPRDGGTRNGSHFSTVHLNQQAYSEIRRFVVIGEGYGNTICSPIQTYSGQGTLKANLPDVNQHAIIYTSSRPPREMSYIAEDGTEVPESLDKDPIRVRSEQRGPEGVLDPASRLNYSKVYTVENYVRVLNIGMVHDNSMESLANNCYLRPRSEAPQGPRYIPSRSGTSRDDDRHRDKGKKKRR